ncbi:Outer membrane protein A [Paraburkholderia kururiensis]
MRNQERNDRRTNKRINKRTNKRTMKSQQAVLLSVCLAAAVAIEGCAVPHTPPQFPDAASASPAGGTFVNVANLRNVSTGLNKDQLYELIGPPQFHEWFVGNHVWNYLFDFRRGDQVVSCQYQVQFDKNMRVSGTYWRDPQCADFVREAAAPTPPAADATKPAPLDQFTIQGEALFPFGKSSLDSMLPGGRAELDAALAKIHAEDGVTHIDVVGHTDRIGSEESNRALSQARAETVKRYFVAHGLDAQRVRAEGVGSSQPVSHCPSGASPAVIACLQADRRVTISVYGQR